ncbi:hypothetical protein JX266_010940 [Neoarthrinium moseri]|nr:hypothetical protein JX266_010940 [Neoarthrinium moseri]
MPRRESVSSWPKTPEFEPRASTQRGGYDDLGLSLPSPDVRTPEYAPESPLRSYGGPQGSPNTYGFPETSSSEDAQQFQWSIASPLSSPESPAPAQGIWPPIDASAYPHDSPALFASPPSQPYPPQRSSQRNNARRTSQHSNASVSAPKSVRFADDLEEGEGFDEGSSHENASPRSDSQFYETPRRDSASSVVSTIRQASEAVRHAVDISTERAAIPAKALTWFQLNYGVLTLILLMSSVGIMRLFRTVPQEGQDNMSQNRPVFDTPLYLNFTESLEPIWAEYNNMLKNMDYETWFLDARDADDVISALYNTLPSVQTQVGKNTTRSTLKLKNTLDLRAGLRKRAEASFENFLRARIDVVARMLDLGGAFAEYAQGTILAPGPKTSTVELMEKSIFKPKMDDYMDVSYTPRNETGHLLNHAARALLGKMVEAHRPLYVTREQPAALSELDTMNITWPGLPDWKARPEDLEARVLHALTDIMMAEEAEKKVMKYLLAHSPAAGLWDIGRHKGALGRLAVRLKELQGKLISLEARMLWLKERFDAEVAYEYRRSTTNIPETSKDRLIWVNGEAEFWASWKGILAMSLAAKEQAGRRRQALQAEILRQDYERSSKAWRYERCGNTSCFQIEPDGAFGKIFGSAQRGLRLAGGKKERPFAKRPDESLEKEAQYRMVGAYEKACCGESTYNPWLDVLKYGVQELIYLNPHRGKPWDSPKEPQTDGH